MKSNCITPTFALLGLAATATQTLAQSVYTTPYAFTNFAGLPGFRGTNDGTGTSARFDLSSGSGVAVDSAGNIYLGDSQNSTIRKITPAAIVTTLAGAAGQTGTNDATGSAARFNHPGGVAVDGAGNVFVADASNFTIRKITPAGVVTTWAGSAGQSGSADGTGTAASFNLGPGLAVDGATNLYVADTFNHTIRRITPAAVVTTLAGTAGQSGTNDAAGSLARFNLPFAVAVDSATNVYVAEYGNHTIRKITPVGTNWVVTTFAGTAGQTGTNDATGSLARFGSPQGVAVDGAGTVFVADWGNATVRKITPTGVVTTIAGSAGQFGSADGVGSAARFSSGTSVAVDNNTGSLYVADTNKRISKGTPSASSVSLQFIAGSLAVSNGSFHALLTGPSSSNIVLEASANLQSWTPIQTNTLPPGGTNLSVPLGTNQSRSFRARLAP